MRLRIEFAALLAGLALLGMPASLPAQDVPAPAANADVAAADADTADADAASADAADSDVSNPGAVNPPAPIPGAPTPGDMDAAFAKVKADPNLAAEHTVKSLDWKDKETEKKKSDWREWFKGIGTFFAWIAQVSRVLFWVVIAALIGALIIIVVRIFMSGREMGFAAKFVAPTHVQDLDIRPESLPDDIGATARALWDSGDHRAALALLYRGMLSRLAHVHEVPIRASSTEGDCLALASRKLDAARLDYATRLVRSWQRAIYGGVTLDPADVHALCAQFATHLDPPPEAARTDEFARAAS